jgi:hypothetical protein
MFFFSLSVRIGSGSQKSELNDAVGILLEKRIVIVDIDRKRGRMSANVSQHSKRRTNK